MCDFNGSSNDNKCHFLNITGESVPGSNPDLNMDVCSGSDSTLNGGPGLFSPHVKKNDRSIPNKPN